jgi:glycosyltransferase involved in cell wall biosynthesis
MTVAAASPSVEFAAAGGPAAARPLVAIIANVQTPYRAHLHRRLVREIPEVRIASLFTHDQPDQAWEARPDPEINPVEFGCGEPVSEQGKPSRWWSDWRKGGRMIRWLRENHAAAVLVGGYNDPSRVRVIAWCARAGVPCFLYADSNVHGDGARGWKRAVKRAVLGRLVRRCAGVMPCGSLGAEYFRRYGAREGRLFYFPYEPDYGAIRSVPPERVAEACAQHGLDRARRRAVVCARLLKWKRVDLAVHAFAAVADDRPEWDLLVIGDGPERAALEALVPPPLRGRVRFLGFIGQGATIAAIERASDVLLCPSDAEPWGVVINEAVAAGMAVIATETVGAAAELVRDGVNGRLVPVADEAALARALREVTDPGRLGPMRAASAGVLEQWRRTADPVDAVRRVAGELESAREHGPAAAPARASKAVAR